MKKADLSTKSKDQLIDLLLKSQQEAADLRAELAQFITPKQDTAKNATLSATVGLYRSNGATFQQIADKLNADGYTNSRNLPFNKMTVQRLFKKYQSEQQQLLSK